MNWANFDRIIIKKFQANKFKRAHIKFSVKICLLF